uniref:EF-hand domain-containing protein n=1 Tax=Phaeomonas parva TaxID=124430 RepID=A0A7S1XS08_9STRA
MARAFAPAMTPFEARRPRLRLEYDLQNAPPGSQERSRLITGFREDLKQALHLEDGVDVSVHSVIPAAEADWQTIVEFSFVGAEGIHEECCKEIDVKLRDPNSGLLSGLVTCKLDVSFFECGMKPRTMRSAEPRVQAVLDKYTNMQIPAGVLDLSRFKITLEFEGTVKPLLVPNPRVLRRRACYIWPYEVKEALGVLGTVLDTWMEPIALVPQQLEDFLASPVPFRPSASHEGLKVIDARLLKAGAHYVVEFEDRRSELLDLLADEEHDLIVEKFRAFDTNNNGAISRDEAQAYARARSDEGREKIDAQYEAFIAQAGNNSEEAIKEAEAQRDAHYSKIMEAEAKLLDMLARADTDGDGTLRLEEFAMAEAWWMRSTLNASRVELF